MGLRIFNNVEAQNAHRTLQNTNMQLSRAIERLSSGLRINRAADDAAGLAVSESMRSQIRGMNVASRNAQDGVSLVQVADGAMGNVGDMLQRVRDLAVQAANGTLSDAQRANLDAEVQQMVAEINRVGADTEFNGVKVLAGSVATAASAVTLQVGANSGQSIAFTVATVSTADLGMSGIAVSTAASAASALASIDAAISTITTNRATLGAIQNRLEHTINRLGLTAENLQAAESRIRDADLAKEMIEFTKNQILQQSGTAMLAQANLAPQSVLALLGSLHPHHRTTVRGSLRRAPRRSPRRQADLRPVDGGPMWRLVLGYSVAPLSDIDEKGVWRPPGVGGVEVLVSPPAGAVPDPREHTLRRSLDAAGWDGADCYLHCRPEYYPLPPDAYDVTERTAIAICDWNVAGRVLRLLDEHVDAIVCDHQGVDLLARPGGPPIVPGLLWGWDAASWPAAAVERPRDIDVLFVGSRDQCVHPVREQRLARLGRLGERHAVEIRTSVYGQAYRDLHERARLVFNHSVRGDANVRSFEAPVAGACVLNERSNPTLPLIFRPDRDYATYDESDLAAVVDRLLGDDQSRIAMARAGQKVALDHSYDRHWASIVTELRDAVAGPRRGGRPTPTTIADQWLTSSVEGAREGAADTARRAGAEEAAAERIEALAALGGPRGLDPHGWRIADRITRKAAARPWAIGDSALTLARCEVAGALGRAGEAARLAADALAIEKPVISGLAPTRFDPWQMALERALLIARDDADATERAADWARSRAQWLLACASEGGNGLSPRALLEGIECAPSMPSVLVARAERRLADGALEDAVDDLRRALDTWPLDAGLARRLADVLTQSGRASEASAVLGGLATSLSGFPADSETRAALAAEARALSGADRAPTVAWCWADDVGPAGLVAAVRLRAAGAVPAERLRIACSGQEALDIAESAALTALADRMVDPGDLANTEILVDAHPETERWRRVAASKMVIARAGSRDADLARRMGRPVLTPHV